MPGNREKLIELLDAFGVYDDWYSNNEIADYLIDNGVIIATYNNVGDKWIPVTERLPEESGKYIVCSERRIKVGNLERMEKKVYQAKFYVYPTGCHWGQRDKGKCITNWMPLPEPPKGE